MASGIATALKNAQASATQGSGQSVAGSALPDIGGSLQSQAGLASAFESTPGGASPASLSRTAGGTAGQFPAKVNFGRTAAGTLTRAGGDMLNKRTGGLLGAGLDLAKGGSTVDAISNVALNTLGTNAADLFLNRFRSSVERARKKKPLRSTK